MDVVLWWHLHQPDYREPSGDIAGLPWVRMHALRAYTDLPAFLLEEGPVGMTINIVPSLADQLEDIAEGRVQDRHFRLASAVAEGADAAVRDAFFLHAAPAPRPMRPLPRLDELRTKAAAHGTPTLAEARDACVLFHLSWLGFTAFQDPAVQALFEKGSGFDADELSFLLNRSREMAAGVLPRLRKAAESGACHLTATPYYHPILPLLIDTTSAHEATHDGGAPRPFGCLDDAREQVSRAATRHETLFGHRPEAMWPAEGSLSEAALKVFAETGVKVVASDETLLRKSIHDRDLGVPLGDAHLHAWRHDESGVTVLFRDRRLSDDWGFVYREMVPEEAAETFVNGVASRVERGGSLCSVILDGENPFEHYPDAGLEHLKAFAKGVKGRVNFISPVEAQSRGPKALPKLATGSWIDASFDIWAGDAEDRRAWALLADVHALVADAKLEGEAAKKAREHLLAAEGSDWFWWYGPEFPIADRPRFDHLFRQHLIAALDAAGVSREAVPGVRAPILEQRRHVRGRNALPLGVGAGPNSEDALWPWINAARARAEGGQGSMHRGAPLLDEVAVLVSPKELWVRVKARDDVEGADVHVRWRHEHRVLHPELGAPAGGARRGLLSLGWDSLPVPPGDEVEIYVEARLKGAPGARLPDDGERRMLVPRPGAWTLEA